MEKKISLLILFWIFLFSYERLANSECALVRDEYAIKGKVKSCFTAEEFFQEQLKEEISRVPNYKTMPNMMIDWERLTQYPAFREGFVLTIEVTHRRAFVFECKKFLAKEIVDPYSWKEPWLKQDKSSNVQQYLYIGKSCLATGKEMEFFLDPACCDNFPTASLSCAFKLMPIRLRDEVVTTCTKNYSR